jgi:hypothetical protein
MFCNLPIANLSHSLVRTIAANAMIAAGYWTLKTCQGTVTAETIISPALNTSVSKSVVPTVMTKPPCGTANGITIHAKVCAEKMSRGDCLLKYCRLNVMTELNVKCELQRNSCVFI